jgi:hypothetical protein
VHFDIAADEQSPHHRARFHVRLALDSGFPPELVERVRTQAYERAVDILDAAVWRSDTLEPEVLRPAVETVIRYLERDDNCAAALKDLLRLLNRLQVARIQRVNAITDLDGNRRGALAELVAVTRRYDPYVGRLESQLLNAEEPDRLVLSDLALWYSRAGQVSRVARAYEESAEYYRRGQMAAHTGTDPREKEFLDDWLLSTALVARKCANDDQEQARRLLETIGEFSPLPGLTLLRRAETWLLLGDLDQAERDATAAPAAPQGNGHAIPDAELRSECQEVRARIERARRRPEIERLMLKAGQAMDAAQWKEAIETLDAILAIDRNYIPALVSNAKCHMAQFAALITETERWLASAELRLAAAALDLATAELNLAEATLGLAQAVSDRDGEPDAEELIRQLRGDVVPLRKVVMEYGGPEAVRLWQECAKASKDHRDGDAIEHLQTARSLAQPAAAEKLDKALASFLNSAACGLANSVVHSAKRPGFGAVGALDTLNRAAEMLREAIALDGKPVFKENLAHVEGLRSTIRRRR